MAKFLSINSTSCQSRIYENLVEMRVKDTPLLLQLFLVEAVTMHLSCWCVCFMSRF